MGWVRNKKKGKHATENRDENETYRTTSIFIVIFLFFRKKKKNHIFIILAESKDSKVTTSVISNEDGEERWCNLSVLFSSFLFLSTFWAAPATGRSSTSSVTLRPSLFSLSLSLFFLFFKRPLSILLQ